MGLDMYLCKIQNDVLAYKDVDLYDLQETNPELYKKLEPYFKKTKHCGFDTLMEEVGYWRKANQIHNWFVENVQDGSDDCNSYIVSKEQIDELLEICKKVKASIVLKDAKVINGQRYEDGEWKNIFEDGKIIEDPTVCEELLPTCEGFFFGSAQYDQWYAEDIDNTIKILERVLAETDFDNYQILYEASW